MQDQDTRTASGSRPRILQALSRHDTRKRRTLRQVGASIIVALTLLVGPNSPLAQGIGIIVPTAQAAPLGTKGTPNRADPRAGSKSTLHLPPVASGSTKSSGPSQPIPHWSSLPMKPVVLALSATQAAQMIGSDGVLEVDVPAGAVNDSDLTNAGGRLNLQVTQIAPAAGSNAGGSGIVSFGTYLVQVVDGQGHLTHAGLRKPVTFKVHIGTHSAVDVAHAFVVENGALPAGLTTAIASTTTSGLAPTASSVASVTPAQLSVGKYSTQNTTLDATKHTLNVIMAISTPSTSMTFNTDSPVATWGKPDPFNVDLNAGALNSSFPIDVPAGPGGLTPPISLTYSSAAVSEQHAPQGAAPWAGEGWNLSLGSISWSEHNGTANCIPGGCSGPMWEDQWQLSDPFGTAAELIPPNVNVSTYYDDSPNNYCGADGNANNSTSYPCPILWHTAPETHAKVELYVGSIVPQGMSANAPCFRVWLTNGIMEEFGCTTDSLQYYYVPGMGDYLSSWNLDLITDPQGNQVHVTYQTDSETKSWTDSGGVVHTYTYQRDVVLNTVEWDSPSCHNAQTMCTGSSWAPLMRVSFAAGHGPSRLTNSPTGCNTGSNYRCDDPFDLSGSNGLAAPEVQSTFVLNDVRAQVRNSGTANWNTLKDYQFSYQMTGPSTITDPATGKSESAAGQFLLSNLVEAGTDSTTALMYSGMDNSSTSSYAYLKTLDVSTQNIVVASGTTLSYWIFPQSSAPNGLATGSNSTCVAIDMIFSDGSDLRDSGAVDQYGNRLHPALQCGHLKLDQWNYVTSNIGANVAGKTINRIDVGYDQPANTGGYRGYVDDISLTNGATTQFYTGFEPGQQQPAWTNTVDININNVGGICCGLTGPELGTRTELAHGTTLPVRTFSYSKVTEYYEDDQMKPNGGCGPSWNTGNGSGCLLWSQSYDGNSWYISSASNGMGLAQTFTWANGRSNMHAGTNSWASNPLYCNSNQSGYPCNEADDQQWSHAILTQQQGQVVRVTQAGQGGTQTNTTVTSTTAYTYYVPTNLPAQECGDCTAGFYWGNENETDYLDYYNGKFMGFAEADESNPDGSIVKHHYYATMGWGVYDTSQITSCQPAMAPKNSSCPNDPWWDIRNVAHGHETEVDYYDTNGTTFLKKTTSQYSATCPPSGVSATPPLSGYGTFDGKLVSALDHSNPVAVCDLQLTQTDDYTYNGTSAVGMPDKTTTYGYDSYGRPTAQTVATNDGGATGSPTSITTKTSYIQNDAVSASYSSASGTYLIDVPALSDTEDSSGNRYSCDYKSYDGHAYATGQQSTLTLGEVTTADKYATSCGTSGNNWTPSGDIRTTSTYDTYGNLLATMDPDANASVSGHVGCTVGSTQYTVCDAYDTTFDVLPTTNSNALNQTTSTGYGSQSSQLTGFGLWPMSATDSNGKTTTFTYDALDRMTSQTLPGEGSGLTTASWTYTDWCATTGAQAPCLELDETKRLNSTTTITNRAFYDGYGDLVETRNQGSAGQDVVAYAYYDASGHMTFESNSYFVSAYSGPPGAAAFSLPDSTQAGTSTTYDGLERTISATDPLSQTTTTTRSVACSTITDDSACYEQSLVIDAKSHQSGALTDALGRQTYVQNYAGNSPSTYTVYATTKYTYDYNGNQTKILEPDGVTTTTIQYDLVGHKTGMADPDRGTESYSYDADGNLIRSVDARGAAGTVYAGYDGLDRVLWRNSTNSSTNAYATFTYDSTATGNVGVGHLTSETFTGGPNNTLVGSYAYVYDQRGQEIGATLTIGSSSYPVQKTYDDSGNVLTQTYPDGEVVTTGYTAQGWFAGLSTQQGSTNTTLVSGVTYAGTGGAANLMTGASLGNGLYTYAASYDLIHRLTSASITRNSDNAVMFQTQPSYDAVSNIVGVNTTVQAGTDNQAFCYDEQNRLTWASSASVSTPCGGTQTAGTLSAAQYTQDFSYDNLGRLTSGPMGSYTYGDSAHLHAATSIGPSGSPTWTASYDAAGEMTCRAPTSSTTCAGTQSGAQLSYNLEGYPVSWQNAPTSPSSTDAYLYDGEGNRVEQQVAHINANNTTTTTTVYVGDVEEMASSACTGSLCSAINAQPTTTTYYYAGSNRIAEAVNGVISYLGNDTLGSANVALDSTGNTQAAQLFAPYGMARYSSGTMPTDYGFTGQHSDSVTGLDYYVSRYYDPLAGQFTSADTVLNGLDRYAYVQGNPETRVDADGHCWPWCTMLIGAVVGAVIGGGVSAVTQLASGNGVDWGQVGREAAVGAVSGAIAGLAGPAGSALGGIGAHVLIGAASGAVGQVVSNVLSHKPIGDGVLTATIIGGVTGGIEGAGAIRFAQRFSRGILQRVTTRVANRLAENPGLAREFVTAGDYAAGQVSRKVAPAVYGKAVESMVAREVRSSPILSRLFTHLGNEAVGREVPDFVGRGLFRGIGYDITTDSRQAIQQKLTRSYAQGLQIIKYVRPRGFRLFP